MGFRRAAFTVAFTLFLLIFYSILRAAASVWRPDLLAIPVEITMEHFALQTGLFVAVVLLAYLGASSVTHVNLAGRDGFVPGRPRRGRSVLRPDDGDR